MMRKLFLFTLHKDFSFPSSIIIRKYLNVTSVIWFPINKWILRVNLLLANPPLTPNSDFLACPTEGFLISHKFQAI